MIRIDGLCLSILIILADMSIIKVCEKVVIIIDPIIIDSLISGIVMIIVAVLGYLQVVKTKKDNEYRKLQEELQKEREEKMLEEKLETEERLKAIEESVKKLSNEVTEVKTTVEKFTTQELKDIRKQLQNLHKVQSENFSYIYSLSDIVVGVGETISDMKSLDPEFRDKLGSAIETHKKKEVEIHERLYKMII